MAVRSDDVLEIMSEDFPEKLVHVIHINTHAYMYMTYIYSEYFLNFKRTKQSKATLVKSPEDVYSVMYSRFLL